MTLAVEYSIAILILTTAAAAAGEIACSSSCGRFQTFDQLSNYDTFSVPEQKPSLHWKKYLLSAVTKNGTNAFRIYYYNALDSSVNETFAERIEIYVMQSDGSLYCYTIGQRQQKISFDIYKPDGSHPVSLRFPATPCPYPPQPPIATCLEQDGTYVFGSHFGLHVEVHNPQSCSVDQIITVRLPATLQYANSLIGYCGNNDGRVCNDCTCRRPQYTGYFEECWEFDASYQGFQLEAEFQRMLSPWSNNVMLECNNDPKMYDADFCEL